MCKFAALFSAMAAVMFLIRPAAAQDDVKAIVDKAIKAHGGEEKLTKFKAWRSKAKGSLSIMGMDVEFTAESASQMPDKMRNELKLEIMGQTINLTQVFDGKNGWASANGQVMDLAGDELAEMKEQVFNDYVENVLPLRTEKSLKLEAIGEEKVDGKTALGIKVTAKGHKDLKLFFDKESGLLVKSQKRSRDPGMQEVDAESFYRDYKDYSGVKQAAKVMVKHDGKKFLTAEITEVKMSEKLEDALFGKP